MARKKPFVEVPRRRGEVPLLKAFVSGRPVPWKAATVTRSGHTFKDANLVAWQDKVAKELDYALWRHDRPDASFDEPFADPVALRLGFTLVRKGLIPDLTNLVKAAEDAVQKSGVIKNDRQVIDLAARRIFVPSEDQEGVTVIVYPYVEIEP